MDLGVAECPCGTKIDKANTSGICVACGTVFYLLLFQGNLFE
jgi:hypothetical protein